MKPDYKSGYMRVGCYLFMLEVLLHLFEVVILGFYLRFEGGVTVSGFMPEGNLPAVVVE